MDLKKPDRFSSPRFKFIQADVLSLDVEWLRRTSRSEGARDQRFSPCNKRNSCHRHKPLHGIGPFRALEVALAVLKKGGHFLCKVFEGPDVKAFRTELARHFAKVQTQTSAVRKASREIYVLALNRSPRPFIRQSENLFLGVRVDICFFKRSPERVMRCLSKQKNEEAAACVPL